MDLRQTLEQPDRFALGVELVSTRGTVAETRAGRTIAFARALAVHPRVDWVSITDNAGGNPQLAPAALGGPIRDAGRAVVIHLSCKDFNRNGLESEAWHLASEGFHNALKGGWWMAARNRCRPATTAHDDYYKDIQIGVRCCADAPADSGPTG